MAQIYEKGEKMADITIFEKIVNGEIPCDKVMENDEFLAFYDINPRAKIHILVIPKKHFENFQAVDSKIMQKMTEFIHDVTKLLGIENGYRLITNCGKSAGQEVMHLHFHILAGENLTF